jgi:hypothetical protein
MAVKKKEEKQSGKIEPRVEHFHKFNKARMVFISGNFQRGGFSMSQNKISAILQNIEVLKKFAEGEYNEDIDVLSTDEVFVPDED